MLIAKNSKGSQSRRHLSVATGVGRMSVILGCAQGSLFKRLVTLYRHPDSSLLSSLQNSACNFAVALHRCIIHTTGLELSP